MDIVKLDSSYSIVRGYETKQLRERWKAQIKGAFFDPLVKRGFKSPWTYYTTIVDNGLKVMNGHLLVDGLVPQDPVKFDQSATEDLKLPFKPYDFQMQALKTCLTNTRCLIKMCTGSGKSLVIAMLAHILVRSGYKGLLLVPNINLLEQFKSDIKSYNLDFLYNNLELLGGGSRPTYEKPLLISTWQSLVNIDKKDKVWVVNLSPFDDSMNPGLFSMEELNTLREMKEKSEAGEENSVAKEANDAEKEPVLRVVEEEAGTLPSEQMFYQVPMEMYSLSSTDQISSFIQQLKKEKEDEGEQKEAESKSEAVNP